MATARGKRPKKQTVRTVGNVSVVVPAYNAAATLGEALDSVLAQTYPSWEVVVVNDGSTDSTEEIAQAYAAQDARIRVVTQENGGESAARNTGIEQAQYDWLVFLDSDDWIAPTHLEKLTAALATHRELDAVHCGSVRVTVDGTHISDDYQAPEGDLFPTLARRAAFPVHACIVRKALVNAVGKLDTSLDKCPDWDLWQRIARSGARFGAVREVLAYYRIRPSSSSLEAEQLFRDGLTVLRRGHAPDPRVANPLPQYANGLTTDRVESQVFYLLCWAAGLLLGEGRDARVLLEQVRDYHFPGLYPDAIAQCILEAGTLPASQPRQVWDSLFPATAAHVEEFLTALEVQSGTQALAAAALQQLKRMILKNSPVWGSVIEQQEREDGEQKACIEQQDRTAEQQKAVIDSLSTHNRFLEEERERLLEAAQLRAEKAALQREVEEARAREAELRKELEAVQHWESQVQELEAAWNRERVLAHELEMTRQRESMLGQELDLARHRAAGLGHALEAARHWEEALGQELQQSQRRESNLRQEVADGLGRESVLKNELEELRVAQASSVQEVAWLEEELEEARTYADAIATERRSAEDELRRLRLMNEDRERSLTALRGRAWVRAVVGLGLSKRRDLYGTATESSPAERPVNEIPSGGEPDRGSFTEAPPDNWTWQLRLGPHTAARLSTAAGYPEAFRVAISKAASPVRWDIQVNRVGLKFAAYHHYVFQFRIRAEQARTIAIGVARAYNPWSNLGFYDRFRVTEEWQTISAEFTPETSDENARIHLDLGRRRIAVEVAAFRMLDLDEASGPQALKASQSHR
jgi:glycosyltransferase involved in cell wall biosynthesis